MTVDVRIEDAIAIVTMDDGKANAISNELLDALEPALDRADAEASAVVLAGRPGRFCAGFDLRTVRDAPPAERARLVQRGGRLLHRLYGYPKPLVAAATGHAVALGALILLAADTRIGARGDYKLGLNETAIGLPLPVFGLELARARLRPEQLTAAVIQARLYDPDSAAEVGYLDAVADEAEVVDSAIAVARQLAELPTDAYRATKLSLRDATLDTIARSLDTAPG